MKQAEEQLLRPDKFFQPPIILLYYRLPFTVFFFQFDQQKDASGILVCTHEILFEELLKDTSRTSYMGNVSTICM